MSVPAPVFVPADVLLPNKQTDLFKWAVMACDQFTSQPEYWEKVDEIAGDAPSTLRIILPEVYLEDGDTDARIKAIHAAMKDYQANVLESIGKGFVYVERDISTGVRQGLVGCVDLEAYSYEKGAQPGIRPSENTVVERIPPRLAVRKGAVLESPHILMLVDDPEETVIEPFAKKKNDLKKVYDLELMLGGGNIRGWAITQEADIQAIYGAIAQLANEEQFNARYNAAGKTKPFALAVGDGNHSVATAKALWEETKKSLSEAEQQNHPARFCMVELENIQSPANAIEPIHRVLFDVDGPAVEAAIDAYAQKVGATVSRDGSGDQRFTLLYGDKEVAIGLSGGGIEPLSVGSVEKLIAESEAQNPGQRVDYVHGDDSVKDLVAGGAVGILLPPFQKADLFRGVALGGVLPKKTFSMGHAEEKRYYMECRTIL